MTTFPHTEKAVWERFGNHSGTQPLTRLIVRRETMEDLIRCDL